MISFERDVQASEASYAKHRLELGEPDIPRPLNTAGVLWLTDPTRVPFRGRMYLVPPLPYKAGIEAMVLQQRFLDMQAADAAPATQIKALEVWATDAAAFIRRNVEPEKWARLRYRLRLMRNPFKLANFRELGELLGFLLRSQTTTSVVGGRDPAANNQSPSIYSTDSRSTSQRTPRG